MSIIKVPMELKENFLRDPENFIRDIAAIPLEALRPFFKRRDLIDQVVNKKYINPFDEEHLEFDRDFQRQDGDTYRRFMHIDLGIRHDAVGISMCHCPEFVARKSVQRQPDNTYQDITIYEPIIKFDFLGRIKVKKGEEILLSEIRDLIFELSKRGFFIALVTYDQFQSTDSIQLLKREGYTVGRLSIDRTTHRLIIDRNHEDRIRRESTEGRKIAAMQALKDALYEERLIIPYHPYWKKEALSAEYNEKKIKVDHPPMGSIDLLQSIAGSIFNLINNEYKYDDREDDKEYSEIEDNYYTGIEENDLNYDDTDDSFYEDHKNEGDPLTQGGVQDEW